ncbi:helix-turn-helix domain-containing protein [Streptomyces sp. V4-01]|uniref:Helix-turn-helix domain-containing protein n=1 Tax=Actinacidiphila polyblastidii TaxID=3110430 RepID=A0ABU7P9K6_9ACTN|nr:helix-turn-helix domain-containing protein [Streptomyces sp. V4-01]
MDDAAQTHTGWTFLTNHARVLAAIARDPGVRVRDIAAGCLLTERAVQKIIADLEADGYLAHSREGRSNVYTIPQGTLLRHPADTGPTVADLLSLLAAHEDDARTSQGRERPRQESVDH